MEITLPHELEAIIRRRLSTGRYASAGEVIGEALLLLEDRDREAERRLEDLRREIQIGLDQADRGELLDGEEVFDRLLKKYGGSPGG